MLQLVKRLHGSREEHGNLVDFCLMPGQAHDLRETDRLIRDLSAGHLLADRAFDADWLRNDLLDRNVILAIPPKSNRKLPAEFDPGRVRQGDLQMAALD